MIWNGTSRPMECRHSIDVVLAGGGYCVADNDFVTMDRRSISNV
jgi:hypothetical protein